MNHSFYSADRMTHLKIVVVALVAAAVLFNGSDASPVGAIIPTPGGAAGGIASGDEV